MNHPDVVKHFTGTAEANKAKLFVSDNGPIDGSLFIINGTNSTVYVLVGDIQKSGAATGIANSVSATLFYAFIPTGEELELPFYGRVAAFDQVGVFAPGGMTGAVQVWGT
jgi:hypothetical protein